MTGTERLDLVRAWAHKLAALEREQLLKQVTPAKPITLDPAAPK